MHLTKKVLIGGGILLAGIALTATVFMPKATSPINVAGPSSTVPVANPNVMVALGDSLSAASNSCGRQDACFDNSWSTGDNTAVDSVAARIEAATKRHLTVYNFAHIGDKVSALNDQLDRALPLKPGTVTILIGANDLCTADTGSMTEPTAYDQTFRAALRRLHTALPDAKVLVASTINPKSLWGNLRDNPQAVAKWANGLCPTMLTNATSNDPAVQQTRQAVIDRADQYNALMAAACKQYGSLCHYTDAPFHFNYTADTVSNIDYLHPNPVGQAQLAALVYSSTGTARFLTE